MKKIVITGMTSGIGKALFEYLVQHNYYVIGMSRSQEKLDHIHQILTEKGHSNFELHQADFLSFNDIDRIIKTLKSSHQTGIDILINNAAMVPKKKVFTQDGFERQFQANHLAVFKISFGLLELLEKKQGQIITTASNAHRLAKYKKANIDGTKFYHSVKTYGKTKLYNIYFTSAFNEFIQPKTNINAIAVHPGLVKTNIGTKDTSKLYAWFWEKFTKRGITPEQAILTYIDLIEENIKEKDHFYFSKSQPERLSKTALNKANRNDLWLKTLKLLNITY